MLRLLFFIFAVSIILGCDHPKRFDKLDADDTGITFNNFVEEKDSFNILHNEYMYNGGGVGAGDLNNDGLSDLVFSGNKVLSKVYINEGNFKFKDISKNLENLTADQWFSGIALVDINSDGLLDIYMTSTFSEDSTLRKNKLWVNQGNDNAGIPSFKEQSAQYGIDHDGYTVHAGFFDYDLDGDLDLFLLNNIVNTSVPTNYRPKMNDGSAPNNDKLFRNDGGKFTDVTMEAGIVHEGFGLGLAFGDINKDGYPDIYVSNDYISNDILYINQKNGTFKDRIDDYVSYQSRFSMGNDMVDMNNDGNLDIMSVDMMPESYARKKQTINGNGYVAYINNAKYGYAPQYMRNMIHYHNGFLNGEMLPMSEVGQMVGLYETEWSWSPLFADYDNDGDRDLLMTNGFPKDLTDKDFTNYKAQVYGYVANDAHMLSRLPIVKVPNYAFENTGDYTYINKTDEWGMNIPSFSNGAVFTDLDNDGDLDYIVNNINEQAFVYRNNTIGKLNDHPNFLKIKLEGDAQNKLAIGTKIELWSGNQYCYHEQFLTRGYISSVDPVIHFGLADAKKVDSLVVHWPNGKEKSVIKDVAVNQTLKIEEKSSGKNPERAKSNEETLFGTTVNAMPYAHQQSDYIDFFQNQRILQHKMSQIGPCIVKGDLNGDGVDDILAGGSVEMPTAVFLSSGEKFVSTTLPGLTDKKSCDEADMAIFDADGDGDNDIISVSGGYSTEKDADYTHFEYRNDKGSFTKVTLAVPAFPASVVRPFDFDHDGDQDIFIGARVKRNSYPLAPESYILINSKGTFAEGMKFDLGMVTDAVWSDVDKDGWEDLLITREWNSIAILKNDGKKLSVQEDKVLSDQHGLWSAITAGDLDKDGDDDYVVGNLGENHRFTISNEFPMRLYGIDLDKNGFIDPIASSYWKDREGVMQEYPVNYMDELASQSPFFRKRFTSYTRFSYATMDSIVDRKSLEPNAIYLVNTTTSFILWNENGNLKWERLPSVVQTSPVRKILIDDFDEDGNQDIIIAGNDHSFDVSTGNFDANKGVFMKGKGDRKFELLEPSKSGLLLNGHVSSLVYLKGSKPKLVVGVNRDSVVVIERKQLPANTMASKK